MISLEKYIDHFTYKFELDDLPYVDYPKRTTHVIFGDCNNGGVALPSGGGPGQYLTKDPTGKLIWKKINDCLFKQTFIVGTGSVAPYNFTLAQEVEKVHQVFVNGQLLANESLIEHTENSNLIILNFPTVLENDTVTIFAGCKSINIVSGGGGDEALLLLEENFTWLDTNSYIFNTLSTINKVYFVFINGQKLKPVDDFSYTTGTNNVEINSPNILEDTDEIDIIYSPN